MVSINTAGQDFQRWWFSMPGDRRIHIEHHLELAQSTLTAIQKLDLKDRSQYEMWKQIRVNSGWSLKGIGPIIGVDRIQMGRYEGGKRIPGKNATPIYRAMLWNMAADQYHGHLIRLGWALFHAELSTDAPEAVEAREDFLEWSDKQHQHPIIGSLPQALPYDETIEHPISISAA